MNTRQVIDTSPGPVSLSSAFNNDNSCFAIGLDSGFCVYSSDPCELRVSRDFNAGIGVVEMLGQSNYMALVGGGRKPKFPQNKLIIWDDVRQKPVITLEFRTSVLRVRITRSYIAVALHNSVHIFAFSIPPTKKNVFDTADNPLGLVCLGENRVVFPGRSVGQVRLVELETGNVSIIPAHDTPLRAIDLSPDGSVLATASESGTLIRIFATSNCAKVDELRRGVDYAEIYSVAISPSNLYLAVTSDKSTLHIFDLAHSRNSAQSQHSNHDPEEDAHQKWGILSKMPLLPRFFSDKYSFASTPFDNGDEPPPGASYVPQLGSSFGRPSKGVIGWLNDEELLVISAGQEGKWQKFIIAEGNEGKRICVRQGWKRYLGGG